MKLKIAVIACLLVILSSGGIVMAHGGMSHSSSSGGTMEGMDMSGSKGNDSMQGMDMNGSHSMKDSNNSGDMQGMDMGEKPVKETPANMRVLGTYGAINLSFIMIGVWNKWFRRKDGSNVSAE